MNVLHHKLVKNVMWKTPITGFMEEGCPVKLSQHELDFIGALRSEKGSTLHVNGDLSRFAQRFAESIVHKDVTFPNEGRDMRARQFALLGNYFEVVFVCQKSENMSVSECALEKLRDKGEFRKFLDMELNSIGVALVLLKSGRLVVVVFAGRLDTKDVTARVVRFRTNIVVDEFSVDGLFELVNDMRDKFRLPKLHKDVAMFKALNKVCRKTNNIGIIEEECQRITEGCGMFVVTKIEKNKHGDYFRGCFGNNEFVSIALSPALSAAMQLFWAHGFNLNVVVVTNELRSFESSLDLERRFAETPQPKRPKAKEVAEVREIVTPKYPRHRRINTTPRKLDFVEQKPELCMSELLTHASVNGTTVALEVGDNVIIENYHDEIVIDENDEIVTDETVAYRDDTPMSLVSPLVEDNDIYGWDVEAPWACFFESESLLDVPFRLLDLNRRFYNHYSVVGSVSQRIVNKINKFRRNSDLKQLRYDWMASSQLTDLLCGFRNKKLSYMQMKDNIWKMNEQRSSFCCRTFSSTNQRTAKDEFLSDFIAVDTMKCFLLSKVNRIAFAEFAYLNKIQIVCLIYVH